MKPVEGGARGAVLFCLHEAINKLGFSLQASYDDKGNMVGLIAGTDEFLSRWVPTCPLTLKDHSYKEDAPNK